MWLQEMDLFAISRTWKELVEKAKAKKLSPAEYSSGNIGYIPLCVIDLSIAMNLSS